jgi:hypothetical protein
MDSTPKEGPKELVRNQYFKSTAKMEKRESL